MGEGYKTRQRAMIEQLLKERAGEHLTADEITELLLSRGCRVGKATVYRCLDRLIERGEVRRYSFEGEKSASYEYQAGLTKPRYHLQCSKCGGIAHLECGVLDELPEHIMSHHGFRLDASQIVLVGCCQSCGAKPEER